MVVIARELAKMAQERHHGELDVSLLATFDYWRRELRPKPDSEDGSG
jgi:hypothetical protein